MEERIVLTQFDYNLMIRNIYNQVIDTGKKYTHILGISRGGLIPATNLSHRLDLPLALTSYSAPDGKGEGTHDRYNFHWQDDKHVPIGRGSVVLVVDDIVDSGLTMTHVVDNMCVYAADVDYATLYEKETADSPMTCLSLYATLLPEDAPWVIFPWEINA